VVGRVGVYVGRESIEGVNDEVIPCKSVVV